MMPRQLPLDLPTRKALGRADFFVSACNEAAFSSATFPAGWPVQRMVIAGPEGSGRTHLAHVFAEATQGTVIGSQALRSADLLQDAFEYPAIALDDANQIAGNASLEEAVFHLHTGAETRGIPLLLTGPDQPGTWGITLPDLASRLSAYPVTTLCAPDDELLLMVLAKLFDDRQIAVGSSVLEYLVRRMNRSLDTAEALVTAIDHAALEQQRKVTQRLAAQVLAEFVNNPR